jgi:hypothetical protein
LRCSNILYCYEVFLCTAFSVWGDVTNFLVWLGCNKFYLYGQLFFLYFGTILFGAYRARVLHLCREILLCLLCKGVRYFPICLWYKNPFIYYFCCINFLSFCLYVFCRSCCFIEIGSHFVAKAGLKLTILLSQLCKCWDYKCPQPCLASNFLLDYIYLV